MSLPSSVISANNKCSQELIFNTKVH